MSWTKTVKVLIAVNAAAYLATLIVDLSLGRHVVESLFGYSWFDVVHRGWAWQPLTYMFVHWSLGHFVGNMLGLFFFAGDVERTLGRNKFIAFYLACGLGGAALGSFYSGGMIGASAAVYGVLIAFAILFPDAQVMLFMTVPVKARYLALGYVFISVAGSLIGGDGVAHLAHLGGIVVAGAWMWGEPVWSRLGTELAAARQARRTRRSAADQQEMDRILAKVHQEGIHSLTATEKRFLNRMSRDIGQS